MRLYERMTGRNLILSQPARHVSNCATHQGDFKTTPPSPLCPAMKDFYSDLDETRLVLVSVYFAVWLKRAREDPGGQPFPTPPACHKHSQTHCRAVIFHPAHWASDRSGRGSASVDADWQDWHLYIVPVIMGICLDAPVWGPSRVHGCCHRDGGEPLVVWGQTETPLFSWGVARHDPPWLSSFDLGGKQWAASQKRNRGFQVLQIQRAGASHPFIVRTSYSPTHRFMISHPSLLPFFFLLNGHPANHRCLFNPPVSAMGLCPVRPGTLRCCVDASSRLQQRHFSVLGSRIRFILQK